MSLSIDTDTGISLGSLGCGDAVEFFHLRNRELPVERSHVLRQLLSAADTQQNSGHPWLTEQPGNSKIPNAAAALSREGFQPVQLGEVFIIEQFTIAAEILMLATSIARRA